MSNRLLTALPGNGLFSEARDAINTHHISIRVARRMERRMAAPRAEAQQLQLSPVASEALYRLRRVNIGEARKRLQSPALANEPLFGGTYLLHAICEQRDASVVRALLPAALAAGAKVHQADSQGCSPLYYAANNCDPEAAEAGLQLLLAAGADPSARAIAGLSPLHTATRNTSPAAAAAAIRTLVLAGAPTEAALAESAGGGRPLHMAVAANDAAAGMEAAVEALIGAGADVGAADARSRQPLHIAAARCRDGKAAAGAIRALLAAGAAPNAPEATGLRPLHLAIGCPLTALEGVQALLAGGADPGLPAAADGGRRPIHMAALLPDANAAAALIAALVAAGADVDAPDGAGKTALQLAAAAAAAAGSGGAEENPAAAAVCALVESGASAAPLLQRL